MKIFYPLNDRNAYKIISVVIFFSWFIFALCLSIRNIYSLGNTWHRFYGKTEAQRLQLVAPDISPTIEICQESTPESAKLLIISAPITFLRVKFYQYYLYPRLIYWQPDDKDIKDILTAGKEKEIDYYVIYDVNKKPILKRLN